MFGALLLFRDEFIHVVSISFTALILTELIMVALTIRTWHWLMVLAEFLSLAIYILSLIILKDFFGKTNTGCPLWMGQILKSYCGFIFGARLSPPPHHFYGGNFDI